MTVAQLMEEYVTLHGLNHWSAGTLSANQHRINDYIIPYIGKVPIKTLTTHRLEQFYRKLLTKPAVKCKGHEQTNKMISPAVVEKIHDIIRSALNQAIRWDYLKGPNPAMTVELPKYRKNKREAWTEQEAYQALSLCTDPMLTICMPLALGCSIRIGEILGLTWDCVHMEEDLCANDEAYLLVEKELRRCNKESLKRLKEQGRNDVFLTFPAWKKTYSTTVLVLKTPKTESGVRTIYLPARVTTELKKIRAHQQSLKEMLGSEYQDFNLVIAHDNGRPVEKKIITDKLKNLIQENNLKPVVFHSLRHSSTSMKLKISGGDIKAVQGDTGHSQANMVTDIYSHIFDADRKHLARKVNEQFFCPEPKKAAEPKPDVDESTQKLIQLLQTSPEQAKKLLQVYELISGNN
ncbi:MAG: site-specific integrase [Eubacteriales bacterium]|nr:site-specific integrase [Eubacteriales bacterium]